MRGKNIIWLSIAALLLFSMFADLGNLQITTRMYVDPPAVVDPTKVVGSTFAVSIKASDVVNLYGWSFKLLFNKDIVQVTGITIPSPSFLRSAGPTIVLQKKYDNVVGYAIASEMLWPYPAQGVTGSGTLATITFSVVGVGVTALDLTLTKLNTVISGNSVPMEHFAEDGTFDNRVANLPPVAIFSVTPPIGVEGDIINFDASACSDDGWITGYFWDFGDGTNATSEIVTHTWSAGFAGVYTVTLAVTDNDGVSSSAQYAVNILPWMEAGNHPDLVHTLIWPERSVFKEADFGEHETLWAKVGNPTEDTYQVRVDFQIYSKDEGRKLGTISTAEETVLADEIKDIPADFFLGDPRWATTTGPWNWPYWVKKYWAIGQCFYLNETSGQWEAGRFIGANQFKVHPVNHDRAITAMSANYNLSNPAHIGDTVEISVTLENQGQQVEHDIHLTVYIFNGDTIGTATLTLTVGEAQTLTFNWTVPVGTTPGNYVVVANIDMHPYEEDTFDQSMHILVGVV